MEYNPKTGEHEPEITHLSVCSLVSEERSARLKVEREFDAYFESLSDEKKAEFLRDIEREKTYQINQL
jgi:hypothetical protein